MKWQDGVAQASFEWTREQMSLAVGAFERIFGFSPRVHGAAGWQLNDHVPALERHFGFEISSDTRGQTPFLPAAGGILQIPTTLPTLDELVGVDGADVEHAVGQILALSKRDAQRDHVFTLHAELEGGAYHRNFEHLLRGWQESGFEFRTLGDVARTLDRGSLRVSRIDAGVVEGRSGTLAIQSLG